MQEIIEALRDAPIQREATWSAESSGVAQYARDVVAALRAADTRIAELEAVSDGVNRRCGVGPNELPLVSLDRILAERDKRIAELEAFIAELEAAAATETMEVDQALGRALHYPPNPDGQPGVCTGEHTSVTLAVEAANRIAKLEAIVERLCSLPVATAAVRRARRHLPMCSNMPDDDGVPENAIRIQAVLREAAEAAGEEL